MQFDSKLKQQERNIAHVEALIRKAGILPNELDIMILPEFAFTGYVFKSREDIEPYLEDPNDGLTVSWARDTYRRLGCVVIAGFPEKGFYNSVCIVDDTMKVYRKTHLYYNDDDWGCKEGKFQDGIVDVLGLKIGVGICMDLNPYKFESPFYDFEFSSNLARNGVDLAIVSMAWLKSEEVKTASEVLRYWLLRLAPLYAPQFNPNANRIRKDVIFAGCNRIGTEEGVSFAGCSSVVSLSSNGPTASVLGQLAEDEEGILIVDV